MTALADPRPAALNWLARLPLLGAYELSLLLDLGENVAASLLGQLARDGWLDTMIASSPEFEPARLYSLSDDGLEGLADATADEGPEVVDLLRAVQREKTSRSGQVELTVGVNRLAAELGLALRMEEGVALRDLHSLPLRRPQSAWWPPGVQAYGCLRAGSQYAPFFVAWDRAGAPYFHRRSRVSDWYGFREDNQAWGQDLPCILVICPNSHESAQWERAITRASDRRGGRQPPVLLAEIDSLFSADPLDAVWRRPGSSREAPLVERLVWRWSTPDAVPALRVTGLAQRLGSLSATGAPSPPGARADAAGTRDGISAKQKRLIEWVAFHPLLSADEIAVLLRSREPDVEELAAGLIARGLVDCVDRMAHGEDAVVPRYFLTIAGLKLLALRDGVPPGRYLRHTPVAAKAPGWPGGGRFETLLRQYEHTVGANGFAVRLIGEVLRCGGRVVRWLSASESAERFAHDGQTHWLRPDGVIDLSGQGRTRRLYLEWDRGTMRWPEMREKLRAYALFYAALDSGRAAAMPYLLLITTTPKREGEIWHQLEAFGPLAGDLCRWMRTSVEGLSDRFGVSGAVWRSDADASRRPFDSNESNPIISHHGVAR